MITSYFLGLLWMQVHDISSEKHPDCLADLCKRLSVNWMAAVLNAIMDFFCFMHFSSNVFLT